MSPSQLEFLHHILDECEFILRLTKEHSNLHHEIKRIIEIESKK